LITESDHLNRVLSLAKGTTLKHVVVIGQITPENTKQAADVGIELLTFKQVESRGETENFESVQPGKLKERI
jgi:hypothetical protein